MKKEPVVGLRHERIGVKRKKQEKLDSFTKVLIYQEPPGTVKLTIINLA